MNKITNPKLNNPILVAGWPGMGLVAYKAVAYLIEHLETHLLAQFEMPDIYQLRGINVNQGLVEMLEIPDGKAFYYKPDDSKRSLIFFIGDEQPVAGKELLVSKEILGMAKELGCTEVFTFAAMVTGISHRSASKVWGCTTMPAMLQKMKSFDILPMTDGQISGLNGVLVGIAPSFGMTATCLLGELPYYATQIPYYPASCAVLEKFSLLSGVSIDLEPLIQQSKTTQIEIDTYIEHIKKEAMKKKDETTQEGEEGEEPQKDNDDDIVN